MFLVHIASALVYRFPQASELQCLSVLLRHRWFHDQKCIIILISGSAYQIFLPNWLSSALDSSSGVVRMWVWIPAWPVAVLVSLSKTLNHNCFVLRIGRKAVGPVCCVMHVKETRTLIVKEKGLAPVFLDSRLKHPAGWICVCYKSSVLLLFHPSLHLASIFHRSSFSSWSWWCVSV